MAPAGMYPRLTRLTPCSAGEFFVRRFSGVVGKGFPYGIVRDDVWPTLRTIGIVLPSEMLRGRVWVLEPIFGILCLMYECIYVFVYRCLKLSTRALLKCLISLHFEQVSTLTCITMGHNCELLICYVVVISGM